MISGAQTGATKEENASIQSKVVTVFVTWDLQGKIAVNVRMAMNFNLIICVYYYIYF
jgi:hypothetical protein